MFEHQATSPRVHLATCLYAVAILLALYLVALSIFLPQTLPYDSDVSIKPIVRSPEFVLAIIALISLVNTLWDHLLFSAVAGLLAFFTSLGAFLGYLIHDPLKDLIGNINQYTPQKFAWSVRISADYSHYPLKYLILLTVVLIFLRLCNYRPTTFRLTLLDIMLITVVVAVILGTRGVAMKAYGLA